MRPFWPLLGTAFVLLGCQRPHDDLDPEVVASLPTRPGDAVGSHWSGTFLIRLVRTRCDCPVDLAGSDACATTDPTLAGIQPGAHAEVVHTDGLLVIRNGQVELSGPVNADGTFSIGWVNHLAFSHAAGDLVVRADGVFSNTDAFEADLRARVTATVGQEPLECDDLHFMTGTRVE